MCNPEGISMDLSGNLTYEDDNDAMTENDAESARPERRALHALADLREALRAMSLNLPLYPPHEQPTAEDALLSTLNMIDHGLHMIETFVGPPEEWTPPE